MVASASQIYTNLVGMMGPGNPSGLSERRAARRQMIQELEPLLPSYGIPHGGHRLSNGRINLPKQWAARHRRVTDILTSGDPYQIATLASELRRWDLERGLPDLDRQAYRRALRLLAGEISAVLCISHAEARVMMNAGEEDELN